MAFGRETFPVSAVALQEAGHIADGADVILRALAINIVDGTLDWENPEGAAFIGARLDELVPAVQHHWSTVGNAVVGCHTVETQSYRDELLRRSRSPILAKFALLGDLAVHVAEVQKAQELLGSMSLVVVAGRQASGKDSLAPVFDELGYGTLPMSNAVKDVASGWGLNRDGTMEKIVTGQVLREYFGDGILVKLGVTESALCGRKRLVMFGPRLMGEVETAFSYGGVLIGIAAHPDSETDREIRRARIVARASSDPSRAGDVAKFDEREAIEGPKIAEILRHPECHVFVDNSPLELFRSHFKDFVRSIVV